MHNCTTRAVKSRRGRGQEGDRVEEKERSGGERKEGKKGKSDIACYRALHFTHTGHVTELTNQEISIRVVHAPTYK